MRRKTREHRQHKSDNEMNRKVGSIALALTLSLGLTAQFTPRPADAGVAKCFAVSDTTPANLI
jgi:hypothetical protein